MIRMNKYMIIGGLVLLSCSSCAPALRSREARKAVPATYSGSMDSTDVAKTAWRTFFRDAHLQSLIDSALANNQELNIMLQ